MSKGYCKSIKNMDLGKDKTQKMMADTFGYSSGEEMISKFKEVLNNLEEGGSDV